jgi:hypothetical protein
MPLAVLCLLEAWQPIEERRLRAPTLSSMTARRSDPQRLPCLTGYVRAVNASSAAR